MTDKKTREFYKNKINRFFVYKRVYCELFYHEYRFAIGMEFEVIKFMSKSYKMEIGLGYYTFYVKLHGKTSKGDINNDYK